MLSDSAELETAPPGETSARRSVPGHNQERRRSRRFPFNADVEILEPQSGTKIKGRVTDISWSGCYVDTLNPFLASTAVQIRIVREGQVFEAQAKVAHCKLGMGMGVAFVSAQAEHKNVLGAWIVELGGELPRALASKSDGLAGMSNDQLSRVMSELVRVLMRKGVLTETERQEILKTQR